MKNNGVISKSAHKLSRYNKRWENYAESVRYQVKETDMESVRVTPKSKGKKHLLVP